MDSAINLPPVEGLKLREGPRGREVYCPLRRKWLCLTPEEWVRQHFTAYLADYCGYPRGLMANEVAISLNATSRRCDTVVYSPAGEPLMIVEYKAPSIAITNRVFVQIARYNLVLRVPWLTVSNGMRHLCCRVTAEGMRFVEALPPYADL